MIKKNIIQVFLDPINKKNVIKSIYLIYKQQGDYRPYLFFKSQIPMLMVDWIYQNHDWETPPEQSLAWLNQKFIDECTRYFISNVYHQKVQISYGTDEAGHTYTVEKLPQQMLAEDIRNMDVWAPQQSFVTSKNFRYGNSIVPWQACMHVRNYDRGNQGFAHADPNRASLDTPIYGYGGENEKLYQMGQKKMRILPN